jgi:hypothetical protein
MGLVCTAAVWRWARRREAGVIHVISCPLTPYLVPLAVIPSFSALLAHSVQSNRISMAPKDIKIGGDPRVSDKELHNINAVRRSLRT